VKVIFDLKCLLGFLSEDLLKHLSKFLSLVLFQDRFEHPFGFSNLLEDFCLVRMEEQVCQVMHSKQLSLKMGILEV
jgi:hypothetical protein